MHSLWSADILTLIICSFLLGGFVKGVIGTGLPTIALALLTATIGLKEGMALILLPSILTNIEQGLMGEHLKLVFKRIWSFLLTTFLAVWIGAEMITRVDISWLSGLLGITLLLYAAIGLATVKIPIPARAEPLLSPIVGGVNGLLTGLTGSSVVPGVLYLQSLGLSRDLLIQTMGLLFLTSTLTLAFALQKNQLLTPDLVMLSALAFAPLLLACDLANGCAHRSPKSSSGNCFFSLCCCLAAILLCVLLPEPGRCESLCLTAERHCMQTNLLYLEKTSFSSLHCNSKGETCTSPTTLITALINSTIACTISIQPNTRRD